MKIKHPSTQRPADPKKLEGMVFGQMTILSAWKDERKNTRCLCRCSCGREKAVYLTNLTCGRTRSCGCLALAKRSNFKDIAGSKFGRLTAVEATADRKHGSVVWRCRCDCGQEAMVSLKDLERGRKLSCGCAERKRGRAASDLTGKKFGKLTAMRKTDKRSPKGSVIWECRCECGKLVDIPADSLVSGNQQSCGCLKQDSMNDARQSLHFVDGTCLEWLESRKDRFDNTSGHKGVSQRKNGRYMAKIGFQKRQYYLGTYQNIEEAVSAREEAEELLFGTFIKAYRSWEKNGREEGFHFDTENVREALSGLKGMER